MPDQTQATSQLSVANQTSKAETGNEWSNQPHLNNDFSYSIAQINEELLSIAHGSPSSIQQKAIRSVLIENKKVKVLVDTGSTVNIVAIPDMDLSEIGKRLRPSTRVVFVYISNKYCSISFVVVAHDRID
jgi:hypothetical protein